MLIMDEESSTEQGQATDDNRQYYERNEIEGDKQGDQINEQNDDTTVTDTEHEEDYEGQINDKDYKGIVFTQNDVLCNVQEKAGIPSSWILLDSQSTVDIFCNLKMLHNV